MTYKQIQDRVMSRRNLTSTEARDRVKEYINERYRRVRASIGLGKTRRAETSLSLVSGTSRYTLTSTAKVLTITDSTNAKLLKEKTMEQIRALDPSLVQTSSSPDFYVIESIGASSISLFIWPEPTDTQSLTVDRLTLVTDLSADGDIPVFPEDFHDLLIAGALADEYRHAEEPTLEQKEEIRFEKALRELRYFIAKSRWLDLYQNSNRSEFSRLGPHFEANN
jgi:hypothetical protein